MAKRGRPNKAEKNKNLSKKLITIIGKSGSQTLKRVWTFTLMSS